MSGPRFAPVRVLDVRNVDSSGAAALAEGMLADPSQLDLSRVLIVDAADRVLSHSSVYEALLGAGQRVPALICVVVGRVPVGQPLIVPRILNGDDSALIWVTDPAGITWSTVAGTAAVPRDQDAEAALIQLLNVLRLAEVYDEVRRRASSYGVCSPGLKVVGSVHDARDIGRALAFALELLADPDVGDASAVPDEVNDFVRDLADSHAASSDPVLLPGGNMAQLEGLAREAVTDAIDEVAGLHPTSLAFSGPGQIRGTMSQLAAAGERTAVFRGEIEKLCRMSLDPGTHGEIASSHGLMVAPQHRQVRSRAEHADRVRVLVEVLVDQSGSLGVVSNRLKDLQTKLVPGGGQAHLKRLEESCPRSLVQNLSRPPAFPPPQRWLPAAGAVVTCLSALPGGRAAEAGALLVSALWIVLMVRAHSLTSDARARWLGSGSNAVLALAGGAVGTTIAARVAVPGGLFTEVVLAVVGGCAAVTTAIVSWGLRLESWLGELQVRAARGAVQGCVSVLGDLTADWSGARTAADAADTVLTARSAIDGVRVALIQYQLPVLPPRGSRSGSARYWEIAVRGCVNSLVLSALGTLWPDLASQSPREHHDAARESTNEILLKWNRLLASDDPLRLPDLVGYESPSAGAPSSEGVEVVEQLRRVTSERAEGVWQLCSPTDTILLDRESQGGSPSPDISFAPAVLREMSDQELPRHTVWPEHTLQAGLIRLLPFRAGNLDPRYSVTQEAQPQQVKLEEPNHSHITIQLPYEPSGIPTPPEEELW